MDVHTPETTSQTTLHEENAVGEGTSTTPHQQLPNGANSVNYSNINSEDVEEEVETKLRGDAIGNTMYSESFVTKTLLQLSDVKWSESLEEDLCFLWDMTTEEDICDYLLRYSFPNIACGVIVSNDESRLIEIIVGILANIYCTSTECNIADAQIEIVLSTLGNDDPLILVQAVRFIEAISFQSVAKLTFVTATIMERISFILENSINCQLLVNALSATSSITSDHKIDESLIKGNLLRSCTIAYQSILKIECEMESEIQHKSLQHLMQITTNVCSYINSASNSSLMNEVQENSDILLEEIVKILKYYSAEENLLPFDDSKAFLFDTLAFTFQLLRVNYISDIFICLITISSLVLKNNFDETGNVMELVCYFIGVGDIETLKNDLNILERKEVVSILNEINAKNPSLDISYQDKFTLLYSDYK